jgi:hypothetical protein
MSRGIVKLALSGKVALQLEYREVGGELREPDPGNNTGEADTAVGHASLLTTRILSWTEN